MKENCQSKAQFPAFAQERLDPGSNHFFNKLALVVVMSLILCGGSDLLRQQQRRNVRFKFT